MFMTLVFFLMANLGLSYAFAVLKFGKPWRWLAARTPFVYRYCEKCHETPAPEQILEGKTHGGCGGEVGQSSVPFGDLLKCTACFGFWVGLPMSVILISPSAPAINGLALKWGAAHAWAPVAGSAMVDSLCAVFFNYAATGVLELLDAALAKLGVVR